MSLLFWMLVVWFAVATVAACSAGHCLRWAAAIDAFRDPDPPRSPVRWPELAVGSLVLSATIAVMATAAFSEPAPPPKPVAIVESAPQTVVEVDGVDAPLPRD